MTNELITQAKNEISPIASQINALKVYDAETRATAVSLREEIKVGKDRIEAKYNFKANTKKAHETWKSTKATENAVYEPIDALETTVKNKITAYDREVAIAADKARREAEAKAAEKERKEREALEKKAEKLIDQGKIEQAEAVIEMSEQVTYTPQFTAPQEKTKKLITKALVTNMMQLCKLIGEGVIPFSVVEVSISQLNAWAKCQDSNAKFAGLELYQDVSGRI